MGVVWALFYITCLSVYSIRLVVTVPSFCSAHSMHITLWPVMGAVWIFLDSLPDIRLLCGVNADMTEDMTTSW